MATAQENENKAGMRSRRSKTATAPSGAKSQHLAAFESAREAGLLDGERTAHSSFRAPRALVTALIRAGDIAGKGRQVFVPDTNMYIIDAAGTLQLAASILVVQGLMFHCAVCLAELTVGVGNYPPRAAD